MSLEDLALLAQIVSRARWERLKAPLAMPRNVEIKARIEDFEAIRGRAAEIADEGPVEIGQDDTFFPCDAGRLKLRVFAEDRGELIFYRRADETGPKESSYLVYPLWRTSCTSTLEEESNNVSTKKTRSATKSEGFIPCGGTCDSYGCWKKCRRPDGHGGDHQCDEHGGSS